MKNTDFIELLNSLHAEEMDLHNRKHAQYSAKEEDTLRNFHDGAKAMRMTPEEYCLCLMEKHRQALLLNATGESHETVEVVRERVRDIRLYMALFLGLWEEQDVGYVLAEYFGIDLNKVEAERRMILETLREENGQ